MSAYRVVVLHVRYWRGAIHKWSTSYTFTAPNPVNFNPTLLNRVMDADSAMCYGGGDPTNGGVYGVRVYDLVAKGLPIASDQRFDPEAPGSWQPYSGARWTTTAAAFETSAEVALLVEWPGGLGKTGKPVSFKKWFHAVPVVEVAAGSAQVGPDDIATLTQGAQALQTMIGQNALLGSAAGRIAGNPRVSAFYGNHQMPKGKRRKVLSKADQSALQNFLNGVIAQQAGKQAGS